MVRVCEAPLLALFCALCQGRKGGCIASAPIPTSEMIWALRTPGEESTLVISFPRSANDGSSKSGAPVCSVMD